MAGPAFIPLPARRININTARRAHLNALRGRDPAPATTVRATGVPGVLCRGPRSPATTSKPTRSSSRPGKRRLGPGHASSIGQGGAGAQRDTSRDGEWAQPNPRERRWTSGASEPPFARVLLFQRTGQARGRRRRRGPGALSGPRALLSPGGAPHPLGTKEGAEWEVG